MKNPLHFTIHGHFYQPPRQNPWTGFIENQESASPAHDWNARIAKECYEPNSASRILDPHGRIQDMINNYEYMSFNIGATLMSWIRQNTPDLYERIKEADRNSANRLNGHGNAVAQVYNHIIMPLATPEDRLTQIRWGIRDFEFHFGRKPEAIWLSETAINMDTVVDLINEGIKFTILSPTQAQSFRSLEGGDWIDCSDTNIDTSKAYRIIPRDEHGNLLCEGHLDVFFYHPWLSSAVGFEHLLRDANIFGNRILNEFSPDKKQQLVSIATDGESYGHHEPFGDMCAAWLFKHFAPENNMVPVNYGWYLEEFPPTEEVLLKNVHVEGSAWSCAHGVGRWYRDCGCSTGAPEGWNQKWRTPLRDALNYLKEEADKIYLSEWKRIAHTDAWQARDSYIDALLHPGNLEARRKVILPQLINKNSAIDFAQALRLLEIQRFSMLSFTSCGWFFNDIEGIEPLQNLRFALRALELLQPFVSMGKSITAKFLGILARAESNQSQRNGVEIFNDLVQPDIPAWVKQFGEVAALMHLQLSTTKSCQRDLFQFTLEQNKQSAEISYFKFHIQQLETLEEIQASIVIKSGTLGRTYLAVIEGEDSWTQIKGLDPSSDPKKVAQKHSKAIFMRMSDLFVDSLHRINLSASERSFKLVSKDLANFAQKHSLALDCVKDHSEALPAVFRQGLISALNAEINRLMHKSLTHIDEDLLRESKELIDEAKKLDIKLTTGGLCAMFYQRLSDLVVSATKGKPDEKAISQITGLITIADWMELDINKTALENLAFESYQNMQKYSEIPEILKPMYDWLNFAEIKEEKQKEQED